MSVDHDRPDGVAETFKEGREFVKASILEASNVLKDKERCSEFVGGSGAFLGQIPSGICHPLAFPIVGKGLAGCTGSDDIGAAMVFKKLVCSNTGAVSERFIVNGTPQIDLFTGVPEFDGFIVVEVGRGDAIVVPFAKSSDVSKVGNCGESFREEFIAVGLDFGVGDGFITGVPGTKAKASNAGM